MAHSLDLNVLLPISGSSASRDYFEAKKHIRANYCGASCISDYPSTIFSFRVIINHPLLPTSIAPKTAAGGSYTTKYLEKTFLLSRDQNLPTLKFAPLNCSSIVQLVVHVCSKSKPVISRLFAGKTIMKCAFEAAVQKEICSCICWTFFTLLQISTRFSYNTMYQH